MALQYWRSRGRAGQAAAADLARRLPRRHLPPDERVRPGRRHALAVDRRAARAGVPADAAGRVRRAADRRYLDADRRDGRAARATSWRRSSSSRSCRAPAGCGSTIRATCARCGTPATAHGVLLIFDEIATGFGRTGALFAADHAGVRPDIMCVGKALTGGYLSLAAALCTRGGGRRRSREGELPVLAHGPTFMGNPLACAVANASIALARAAADWPPTCARIEGGLRAGLEPARGPAVGVADVRVLGAIGVVQLRPRRWTWPRPPPPRSAHGVWLRPFRDLIYTMPPYVATDDDVAAIAAAVVAAAGDRDDLQRIAGTLTTRRSRMETFGARLHAAMADARAAVRRHRSARRTAGRMGAAGQRRRPRRVQPNGGRRAGRSGRCVQAAVCVF